MTSSFKNILYTIKETNTSFFCGAGVSFQSGIPLVTQIISEIFNSLNIQEKHYNEFLKKDIPFESFMESILSHTNKTQLFKIFEANTPSQTHIFLAYLAKYNLCHTFITTNFDTCLEKAFDKENINYKVYILNKELEKVDLTDNIPKIIKLHGSIDNPQTLAITIKNISKQLFLYSRDTFIKNLFKTSNISSTFFLGYSFSDKFDINLSLKNIKPKNHKIYIVEHQFDEKTFYELELNQVHNYSFLYNYSGKVIRVNTDKIIAKLWIHLFKEPLPKYKLNNTHWQKYISLWVKEAIEEKGEGVIYCLSAMIFKMANLYKISNFYAFKALRMYEKSSKYNIQKIKIYQTIGDNFRDLRENFNQSKYYFEKALNLAKKEKEKKYIARALLSLGIIYEDKAKKYEEKTLNKNNNSRQKAICYYKKALKISKSINDLELIGKATGNLGIIYKNLGSKSDLLLATKYHQQAIRIAKKIGDKRSEGRSYGNLGAVYAKRGKQYIAYRFYKKALEIAEDLGDELHIGIWLANIGKDYMSIDKKLSIDSLHKAKTIFEKLEIKENVLFCVNLIKQTSVSLKPPINCYLKPSFHKRLN